MAAEMLKSLMILVYVILWWMTPLLALAISVIYYQKSPKSEAVPIRLCASAHGFAIAAIYVGAVFVHLSGGSRAGFGKPFLFVALLPLLLIVLSFFCFRGKKWWHLLQIPNILLLFWTLVFGGMAVTGDWL